MGCCPVALFSYLAFLDKSCPEQLPSGHPRATFCRQHCSYSLESRLLLDIMMCNWCTILSSYMVFFGGPVISAEVDMLSGRLSAISTSLEILWKTCPGSCEGLEEKKKIGWNWIQQKPIICILGFSANGPSGWGWSSPRFVLGVFLDP